MKKYHLEIQYSTTILLCALMESIQENHLFSVFAHSYLAMEQYNVPKFQ